LKSRVTCRLKDLNFIPGDLILFHSCDAVLHGLVDDGVDGADKEVESSHKVLSILSEVSLCLSIVKKLFLKLWRLVGKIRETFTQGTLK
jgi:hypothetical protein